MPTGYTAAVADGSITTLRDFALRCSRGMGALVTMRDEPFDAPVPTRLEPSRWNEERLAETEAKLAELRAMGPGEKAEVAAAAQAKARASWREGQARKAEQRGRYQAMLERVKAWRTEAEGIRSFMLEQLEMSIEGDCPPIDEFDAEPPTQTADEWWRNALADAERLLAYHTRAHGEELERTAERNRWLAALWASLEPQPETGPAQ